MYERGFAGGLALIVMGCGSIVWALSIDVEGAQPVERQPVILLTIEGVLSLFCGLVLVVHNLPSGLARAIRLLQPVAGKPESLLRRYLGAPNDREDGGPDGQLLTWREPGYVVTLAFRDGVCQRVVREEVHEV